MKLQTIAFARCALPACALLGAALTVAARNVAPDPSLPGRIQLGTAPLYFEANRGQAGGAYPFLARGRDCNVLLAPTEAVLILDSRREASSRAPRPERIAFDRAQPINTRSVGFRLEGANPQAKMSGLDPQAGRANYLVGSDPSAWHQDVPLFARVRAEEVYPGIGVVYYCNGQQLEYDFLVSPRARPEQIAFRISGADAVSVNAAGELVLKVGRDEIRQPRPVIYQRVDGVRKPVAGGYRQDGRDSVGFQLGDYDRSQPLVIDPTLEFSTCFGGKKLEVGWSVAFDGAGNIYVAGETLSAGLQGTNEVAAGDRLHPNIYRGGTRNFGDAFVAKFNGTNYQLEYMTYLGGRKNDGALGLAVDAAGCAYLTGFTDSPNFPVSSNAFRQSLTGTNLNAKRLYPVDAFVAKIETNGSALLYSTLLGGSRRDQGTSIAVDAAGYAFVTGITESYNFPATNMMVPPTIVTNYTWVTNSLVPLVMTTNWSTNIIWPVIQLANAGRADAFVAKIGLTGTNLEYSTYLGGYTKDYGLGIAVDSQDQALVTGYTSSTDFPVGIFDARPPSFGNADFSIPSLGADFLLYQPPTTATQSWTFAGQSGVAQDGGGTNGTFEVAGTNYPGQYAFLQLTGTTDGTISQGIYFGTIGWYQISYSEAGRAEDATGAGGDLQYSVALSLTGDTNYVFCVTNQSATDQPFRTLYQTFFISLPGNYLLSFQSQAHSGTNTDNTVLLDVVAVSPVWIWPLASIFPDGIHLNRQTKRSYAADAFVCKLAADGSKLLYSTFLGGSSTDVGLDIAADSQDSAYVTGYTYSKDFPTNVIPQPQSSATKYSSHVFVTKIATNAGGFPEAVYSVAFGSSRTGQGTGIAVDTNSNNAFVTGYYTGTDFFGTSTNNGNTDLRSAYAQAKESKSSNRGFVVALDPAGMNFTNAVTLGGAKHDLPYAIAVRNEGGEVSVVVAGMTMSKDFPATNAVQSTLGRTKKGSGTDAFIEKIRFP